MSQKRVLVVGGGVAGPVLAYWLGKHSYNITVLERSKEQTELGQVIDIEGPSQEIVSRMGILESIREASTHEQGINCVNENGDVVGSFPAGQSAGATKDIEIMRPRLADILFKASNAYGNVEFRYGYTATGLEEKDNCVLAEIQNVATKETSTAEFDIVVACDGLRSRTRDLILPSAASQASIKSLQVYVAFFALPYETQDQPFSRLLNMPGRRTAFIKPIDDRISSAYMGVAKFDEELSEARASRDVNRQKEVVAKRFEGCGWETERLIKGLRVTDNFYFEEISQIKVDQWSQGRCVLLGDTAWCPSPLTGQGTNAAVVGAYILAHSILSHENDVGDAFREYEQNMRPFIDKVQSIPFGGLAPRIVNPDSSWGVWAQRSFVGVVSWLGLYKYFPDSKIEYENLPELL